MLYVGTIVVPVILRQVEGTGFCFEPYDACFANKVINGKQCTIAWYVDDTTKILRIDPDMVRSDLMIKQLDQ